jgi:hypothetical protein
MSFRLRSSNCSAACFRRVSRVEVFVPESRIGQPLRGRVAENPLRLPADKSKMGRFRRTFPYHALNRVDERFGLSLRGRQGRLLPLNLCEHLIERPCEHAKLPPVFFARADRIIRLVGDAPRRVCQPEDWFGNETMQTAGEQRCHRYQSHGRHQQRA